MDSKVIRDWIYILILVLALFLIYHFSTGEGNKCLSNPAIYAMKKINSDNNINISCTCSAKGFQMIFIDASGISITPEQENLSDYSYPMVNFSSLNISK